MSKSRVVHQVKGVQTPPPPFPYCTPPSPTLHETIAALVPGHERSPCISQFHIHAPTCVEHAAMRMRIRSAGNQPESSPPSVAGRSCPMQEILSSKNTNPSVWRLKMTSVRCRGGGTRTICPGEWNHNAGSLSPSLPSTIGQAYRAGNNRKGQTQERGMEYADPKGTIPEQQDGAPAGTPGRSFHRCKK